MNWRGVLHLGGRHLARNRAKTCLLVAAFALVWLLPAAIALVVDQVEERLRARAVSTPLVLGHVGSPLELVFNALYFSEPGLATMKRGDASTLSEPGTAQAIPLYVRFSAAGYRIVGTTVDYFRFRGFEYEEGRPPVRPGECIVGATVAVENGIRPGDSVVSSPETLFDLAGVYPLKMTVVGVLAPTGSPDDRAIFTDLKTTWIIEGLGHGHQDAAETPEDARLADDDGTIRLNASVMEYNEITKENLASFHFHGDEADYPITAAIVIPADAKAQALLKGRFAASADRQLVDPRVEMDDLFATVFSVQRVVVMLLVAVGLATLAIGALVFLLSHRLRREEFRHLALLGAPSGTLRALVAFEAVFVLCASLAVAALGLIVVWAISPMWIVRLVG